MYVCSHYKFYSLFWFQCTAKGSEHSQCVHSTRSSEPLFLSHILHRVSLQCITASPWNQRLNSLYSVGVRSSIAVSLTNMMRMNMKPTGYFNYTLHRCSRFVFVFDKRGFMSLLLAAFQEMKELQSLTWCSGIAVLEEVGRPVFSEILHRRLFVVYTSCSGEALCYRGMQTVVAYVNVEKRTA
jgi:hypothetical protein